MKLVNILERDDYKPVIQAFIKSYHKIHSWLIYGDNAGNVAPLLAREVLGKNTDDLYYMTDEKIGVEEIRGMSCFLNNTSAHNGYKVAVIDHFDSMTHNAYNAVLKVLEEPPQDSIIIIIAHSLFSIPGTIKSRCYKLYFSSNIIESLNENDLDLYKNMVVACKNRSHFSHNGDCAKILKLLNLLIQRLIKNRFCPNLVKEFFTREKLDLETCDCDVNFLYDKWENILHLCESKDRFHLAEQQVNIVLSNIFIR